MNPTMARSLKPVWPLLWLAAIAAVLFLFNPVEWRFFPRCQFHELTGLNCPGCGATRAAHALLHGDFLAAMRDNVLFVVLLPLFVMLAAVKVFWPRTKLNFIARWLWVLAICAVGFGVWRNLPAGAWWNP